jgi:hypothetical protein
LAVDARNGVALFTARACGAAVPDVTSTMAQLAGPRGR